jgi:hypothetical protein
MVFLVLKSKRIERKTAPPSPMKMIADVLP